MAARRIGLVSEMTQEDGVQRRPYEGWSSGEHLVDDTSERINVGPGVESKSFALLGRHVQRGPEHCPRLRHARAFARPCFELCNPEIEHFRSFTVWKLLEEYVLRFEIAVYHSGIVRGVDGGTDLRGELQRKFERKTADGTNCIG